MRMTMIVAMLVIMAMAMITSAALRLAHV